MMYVASGRRAGGERHHSKALSQRNSVTVLSSTSWHISDRRAASSRTQGFILDRRHIPPRTLLADRRRGCVDMEARQPLENRR
jgi:hypothetical protein